MKKIQTKIITMVVAATMCVSLFTGILSMLVTRYSTVTAIEKNLVETARLAALAAENMISTYTLTISEIASNPTLVDSSISPEEKQAFIQSRVDAYYMRFGGITDSRGYDIVHDVDVSQEPFFQAAIQGSTYMSVPYINDGNSYLMISAPIQRGDAVEGILYFQCDTYILQSIVEGLQIGEGGEAYILDKDGTTIAYVDQQTVLDQENAIREAEANPKDRDMQTVANIERKMVAGERGVERYHYFGDGSDNILGYAPIQGTDGWSIAIEISEDEFMRPAYFGNLFQTAACVAACVIVIIVSIQVSRSIANPIVRCANRLQALSKGDLQSPVPKFKSQDETRVLSDSTTQLVEDFRSIVHDIDRVLSAIAEGDLTQESSAQLYPGDFAVLSESLRTINEKLNRTMSGIISASVQVSSGAAQVASVSTNLSQGAIEQTGTVEQLSSTMKDMSHDAQDTAQLTRQTRDTVNGAGVKLRESREFIENLNAAMNLITESSKEIGRIIDAIENIAFQTNILALNASVEAARAGSTGKGFAVVADEVRNLANRSDEAAKATQELIKRSAEAVDTGSQVVSKVTNSVIDVAALAEQAVKQMELVAEAVEGQTGAIEQITGGIDQISSVVQSNSATAEESSATSHQLSGQADALKQLVGSFTLKNASKEMEMENIGAPSLY